MQKKLAWEFIYFQVLYEAYTTVFLEKLVF